MGGDTFANTHRLDRSQLLRVRATVGGILEAQRTTGLIRWCSPKEVAGKESYGDVDFIASIDHSTLKIGEFFNKVSEEMGAIETGRSQNHLSFLTRERFQVDVLVVDEADYDAAKGFYSNGDFSYCLGKMIWSEGLKWSSHGLSYRLSKPEIAAQISNKDLDVVLTRSTADAFTFLGFGQFVGKLLDDEKELQRQELYGILEHCIYYRKFMMSEYARSRLYKKHRERRPMVKEFFERCAQKSQEITNESGESLPTESDIIAHFGCESELKLREARLAELESQADVHRSAKEKFNGSHVQLWLPDLQKRQIGWILEKSREGRSGREYDQWIMQTDIQDIRKEIEGLAQLLGNCDKE